VALFKCVLAGVAAVIGALILFALVIAVYLLLLQLEFRDAHGGVGVSVSSPVWNPRPVLLLLVPIFAAGFWWQWRRMR
jgi:hypothetical protein